MATMELGSTKVTREIDVLRLFNHPNIVRLYEVIEEQDNIYCALEYVDGTEMFDYIVSRGQLSESEARRIFQQLIAGVDCLHAHMVVHRDLKPENIMIGLHGEVKLIDFGLSSVIKDGQFLKTSCGSPNYAAPEVISGVQYGGPEVDVWSCGVILYALLCGQLPFDEDDIPRLFRKIRAGEFEKLPALTPGALDLISRMLVVDPVRRIRISEIQEHPWFVQSLPDYLAHGHNWQGQWRHVTDEEVVADVVKLMKGSATAAEVRAAVALALDSGLTTRTSTQHMVKERALAVSYWLLQDSKRAAVLSDARGAGPAALAPVPVAVASPGGVGVGAGAAGSGGVGGAGAPAGAAAGSGAGAAGAAGPQTPRMSGRPGTPVRPPVPRRVGDESEMQNQAPPPLSLEQNLFDSPKGRGMRPRQRAQWFLGLWSALDAFTVMQELCNTLRVLGLEWKNLTPYKLKARYIYATVQDSTPRVVKLGICLYTSGRHLCLDIQKLHGGLFPFFDLCAALLQRLRASHVAVDREGAVVPLSSGPASPHSQSVSPTQALAAEPHGRGSPSPSNRAVPLPDPPRLTGAFRRASSDQSMSGGSDVGEIGISGFGDSDDETNPAHDRSFPR